MRTLTLPAFLCGASFVFALMATSASAAAFAQADQAAKAALVCLQGASARRPVKAGFLLFAAALLANAIATAAGAQTRASEEPITTRNPDLHSQIEAGSADGAYSFRASAFDSSRPSVIIWIIVSQPELIPPSALQNVQIFSKEGRTIRYRDDNKSLPYLIGSGSQFGGGDTLVARYRLRRGSDYAKLDRVSFTYRDKDYDMKLLPMLAVPLEMNYLEQTALRPPPLAPGGTRQLRRPRSTNPEVAL